MPRANRRCPQPGCDELVPCTTHVPSNRNQAPTAARGYGSKHQREREKWLPLVSKGRVRCARCSEDIKPGERWDLDHSDEDRSVYLGPSHARCNRATARRRTRRPN